MDWAAGAALLVGGLAALVAVHVHRQEQVASMIVTALSHMGGKTQERSAGLAALQALHFRTQPWHACLAAQSLAKLRAGDG